MIFLKMFHYCYYLILTKSLLNQECEKFVLQIDNNLPISQEAEPP